MKNEIAETLRSGSGFRAVTLPIYRLSDEKLVGYEMLSRGPAGKLQSPDHFFKISIENGILLDVDMHCFRMCVKATKLVKPTGRFHINLFPSTILETPVAQLLSVFPADRKRGSFCIEIVEHEYICDTKELVKKINILKKAGIKLAIDDVGFGASSMEALIVLEPDIIKIDRKYVDGVSKNPQTEKYLKRLVKVAEALGAESVAEGIESRSDLKTIIKAGVKYGQGALWGPIP